MQSLYESTVQYHLRPVLGLLEDPEVTEILINWPEKVYAEVRGRLAPVEGVRFPGEDELRAACVNLAQYAGKVFDEDNCRFDGRLPDGSRIHVIGPPVARFLAMSIRKFSRNVLGPNDLLHAGTLSAPAASFLRAAVLLRRNVVISGGTGSGKTTLLSALAAFIPDDERIVVIEDTGEVQIHKPHVVQLEARVADTQGRGRVTVRDLLHSTLRLRPDRIVVGEVRGGEALDLLNALNSGHGGTMTTLHANSALGALTKLETLVLFAGEELPIRAIRAQVAQAVDLVVQISRFSDGSRRVEHVAEVSPVLDEAGGYTVRPLFRFRGAGVKDGRLQGALEPTGLLPDLMEQAEARGVRVDPRWFGVGG